MQNSKPNMGDKNFSRKMIPNYFLCRNNALNTGLFFSEQVRRRCVMDPQAKHPLHPSSQLLI